LEFFAIPQRTLLAYKVNTAALTTTYGSLELSGTCLEVQKA